MESEDNYTSLGFGGMLKGKRKGSGGDDESEPQIKKARSSSPNEYENGMENKPDTIEIITVSKEQEKTYAESVSREERETTAKPVSNESKKAHAEPVSEEQKVHAEPVSHDLKVALAESNSDELKVAYAEPVSDKQKVAHAEPVSNEQKITHAEQVSNEHIETAHAEPVSIEQKEIHAEPVSHEKKKSHAEPVSDEQKVAHVEPVSDEQKKAHAEPEDVAVDEIPIEQSCETIEPSKSQEENDEIERDEYVYRLLRQGEPYSEGLEPKNISSEMSLMKHVENGSKSFHSSQYISCCKTLGSLKRLGGFTNKSWDKRTVVRVNITKLDPNEVTVIDLTDENVREKYIDRSSDAWGYAERSEEVILKPRIRVPADCVERIGIVQHRTFIRDEHIDL